MGSNESFKFLVNKVWVTIDKADAARVLAMTWQLDTRGRVGHYQRKKGLPRRWISLPRFIDQTPTQWHVDHINRDFLDNRRANLRRCTNEQNQRNTPPVSGKYKGVNFEKGKWRARCKLNNKNVGLGAYDTAEEAAKAYNAFVLKQEHWKGFAWLNPI